LNIAIGTRGRLRAAFAALLTLSLLATLVVVETASARTLSGRLAERTATKLLKKQLSDRDRRLVEARISVGERVDKNTFRFLYDDLNRRGEVCVGTMEVRLVPSGGNTVRARFRSTKCASPGEEALAFRTVARAAGSAFVRAQPAISRSVRRYARSSQPCESLDVPVDRQDEATLLLSTGLTQASTRPLTKLLNDYTATLQSLGVTDTQLMKGAAAWRDVVDGIRSLPALSRNACAVLAEWAANGYTDATAPVNFAGLRTLTDRLTADGRELRRTARYLANAGIDPLTASAFTLDDMVGSVVLPTEPVAQTAARILAR
jgi:hypothetical protein